VATALALSGTLVFGASCRAREEAAGSAYEPSGKTPAALAASARTDPSRPEPNKGIAVGDTAPDFTLTDQTGKPVRLSSLRGEPVAVTFVYTRCPDATACPMTVAKFAKLNAALSKEKAGRLLAVTVDPVNDTPEVLADFAKHIGADPARWKFLTGRPEDVARVAESFGVLYYSDHGKIVHSQAVAVLDRDGKLSAIYYGADWEPEQVLQDLEKARSG
jgi:protein SCO1/2